MPGALLSHGHWIPATSEFYLHNSLQLACIGGWSWRRKHHVDKHCWIWSNLPSILVGGPWGANNHQKQLSQANCETSVCLKAHHFCYIRSKFRSKKLSSTDPLLASRTPSSSPALVLLSNESHNLHFQCIYVVLVFIVHRFLPWPPPCSCCSSWKY